MSGYATARQNGWMSANDIRELENLDRIPAEDGGDLIPHKRQYAQSWLMRVSVAAADKGEEDNSNEEVLEVDRTRIAKNEETQEQNPERTLFLNGTIADESWFDDDITPQLFKEELMSGSGDITVWINSPGGDCVAAAQIYNMLMDYKGNVTVKDRRHRRKRRFGYCNGG